MTKEKQPIITNSTIPFPSNAIAAEAARDDAGIGPGAERDIPPEPAEGLAQETGRTQSEEGTALTLDGDTGRTPKMTARDIDVFYGEKQALNGVGIDIHDDKVTAFIGPSGCGKSTFLRCLNRMNDTIVGARVTGDITLDGDDVYSPAMDVVQLRARVGMVFQKPNPFPKSIFENVAYGPRIHGLASGKAEIETIVETALKKAGLWDEVKDRLQESGTALSGGQQQRLCIARAIAVDPEVILMDEPCSALDPIATARIEELIHELRGRYAIAIVTHNMQQAARVSQRTAFFHLGELIEYGRTKDIFTNPREQRTQDYITGRYG